MIPPTLWGVPSRDNLENLKVSLLVQNNQLISSKTTSVFMSRQLNPCAITVNTILYTKFMQQWGIRVLPAQICHVTHLPVVSGVCCADSRNCSRNSKWSLCVQPRHRSSQLLLLRLNRFSEHLKSHSVLKWKHTAKRKRTDPDEFSLFFVDGVDPLTFP